MVLWLPRKHWRYLGNNHFRLLSISHSCRNRWPPKCSDSPPAREKKSLSPRKHDSINASIEFDRTVNSIRYTAPFNLISKTSHTFTYNIPLVQLFYCASIFDNEKPIRSDRVLFFCSDEPSELDGPLLQMSFKCFECRQQECTSFLFTTIYVYPHVSNQIIRFNQLTFTMPSSKMVRKSVVAFSTGV